MRAFLEEGGFGAFTTTFENLHGFKQLPGLAVQRLMAEGYGFGAEGDWKTAAMTRIMKVMGEGLPGGTSFMEDYTYHLDPSGQQVLGAHMLEVCPSIAAGKPSLEVHPLGIGGKDDPARLVFQRPGRSGHQCFAYRHGQPLPYDRERGRGCGSGERTSETAGRPGSLGSATESQNRVQRPGYWLEAPTTQSSPSRSTPATLKSSARWPMWSWW